MSSFTFDLIKTLNSQEKTYIKRQIGSSGKHMLQLFDDLKDCKKYHRESFAKKNKGKLYIKNLSQNQNYLRKKIISELINYRSKTVFEIDMHNRMNELLILIDKKFYDRAKKVIDNCFKDALFVEDYVTCYSLIKILFNNINNKVHFGLTDKEWENYGSAKDFYLLQLNRMNRFGSLNEIYSSKMKLSEKLNRYKAKLRELKVLDKDHLPDEYPLVAKRIFYFTKAQIARLTRDLKKYAFFFKKTIDLYEVKNISIPSKFTTFLVDATNFLNSLLETKDLNSFFYEHRRIMSLIKTVQKNVHCTDDSLIYVIEYLFLQTGYNYGRLFEKSIQFAKVFEEFLYKTQTKLTDKFIARSAIAVASAYLYNKQYETAIGQIEPALNSKDYFSQYVGRILYILTHNALENEFLLDSLFNSFIHYLKTVNKQEQNSSINKLKKHIKNNTVHLLKNEDFEDFVYIHWVLFEKI